MPPGGLQDELRSSKIERFASTKRPFLKSRPKMRPRLLQDASKTAQDDPKTAQKDPKTAYEGP